MNKRLLLVSVKLVYFLFLLLVGVEQLSISSPTLIYALSRSLFIRLLAGF